MDGYTEYLDGLNREKTIEIDRLETALDGNSKLIADMSAQLTALESDNARLQQRADAAEGLAGALEESRIKIESRAINLEENDSFLLSEEYYDLVKRIDAALAAYKQAQGK
jgi:hypothetical protein